VIENVKSSLVAGPDVVLDDGVVGAMMPMMPMPAVVIAGGTKKEPSATSIWH
jgi:hypothetical protein